MVDPTTGTGDVTRQTPEALRDRIAQIVADRFDVDVGSGEEEAADRILALPEFAALLGAPEAPPVDGWEARYRDLRRLHTDLMRQWQQEERAWDSRACELTATLEYTADTLRRVLAGVPVRDADEVLEAARCLVAGESTAPDREGVRVPSRWLIALDVDGERREVEATGEDCGEATVRALLENQHAGKAVRAVGYLRIAEPDAALPFALYAGSSRLDLGDDREPVARFAYEEHARKFGASMWPGVFFIRHATRGTGDGAPPQPGTAPSATGSVDAGAGPD